VGYLFALISALLFGANGSLTKVVIDGGLTPAQLTLFRVAGTVLISGAVLLVTNRGAFRPTRRQLAVLAVLGLAGVAGLQYFYAVALSLLPVGITLLLEYTAVLAVPVIAFLIFRERVRTRLWISIGFVLLGLATVAQLGASELDPLGVVFALLAAAALTVYFLVGERMLSGNSAMGVAFWSMLFATLLWLALSGWWDIDPRTFLSPVSLGGRLDTIELPLILPLLCTVVFGSFAPFLFSYLALKRLTATSAGVIAASEVVFAFAVAWLWLGEGLGGLQLLGAGLVLAGILLAQTARPWRALDADLAFADGATVVGEHTKPGGAGDGSETPLPGAGPGAEATVRNVGGAS
jgi:drug/metabolite transporter (DMT)-like permease